MLKDNCFFSDYYEKEVSIEELEEAYDLYVDYCQENNLENEAEEIVSIQGIEGIANFDTGMADHILYHAEIKGFEI
tara:strand:+ start:756 stop:983 length:228 start_codon:yes stop_codon:yes gene_type:complete